MEHRMCSLVGCERTQKARGMCDMHYSRWRKHGDPCITLSPMRGQPAEIRFMAKVEPDGDCWRWSGSSRGGGYGSFAVNGAEVLAHRWAYEHWVAPIPPDRDMDHFRFPQDGCIGRACVNPEHVRPTSTRENVLRSNNFTAWSAAKTHCPQGHPYEGDNLYVNPRGARLCRTCKRDAYRRAAIDPTAASAGTDERSHRLRGGGYGAPCWPG